MSEALLRLGFAASLLPTLGIGACAMTGRADRIDRRLLARWHRRAPATAPTRAATVARDLTALGGDTLRILLLVAAMAGLCADRHGAIAWQLLAIFVSARVALLLFKRVAKRPRPDLVEPGVATFTTSFPSGHTAMAACLFLAMALLVPSGLPAAVGAVAVAIALLVSLVVAATRFTLGIHWPSDIVVGWFAGIAWATGWAIAIAGWR